VSENSTELSKSLGPVMIWALGVGYVISGEYFGWNLGLAHGGSYGMLAAVGLVSLMYLLFVLSYAELACAIPKAGGAFVYADRALGRDLGFLAGAAQAIEYLFAPPAIAYAIGAYFANWSEGPAAVAPEVVAVIAFVIFTGVNIWGVRVSAIFELVVTTLAVIELLIFAGVTLPHFSWGAFSQQSLPNGWGGVWPAIPFAIWLYLAIEGVANIAEEARDPARHLPRAFIAAMLTLLGLALLTYFAAVGVGGWSAIVVDPITGEASDSPLPLALGQIVGRGDVLYHLLIAIGLFGLVASFHGIILVAGRAVFELGRFGHLPGVFGRTLRQRKTPAAALIGTMVVGLIAIASGKTADIITLSAFGALTLYVLSMVSLLRLRRAEPDLERPYCVPAYPWIPSGALVLALVCLVALFATNPAVGGIFVGLLLAAWVSFRGLGRDR
jgi:ethanolamine permease